MGTIVGRDHRHPEAALVLCIGVCLHVVFAGSMWTQEQVGIMEIVKPYSYCVYVFVYVLCLHGTCGRSSGEGSWTL